MRKGSMMRKGQAQFIGWVLLIGFAVVIGAFVGNWMMQQARETTESMIEMTTKDIKCIDVNIDVSSVNCQGNNVISFDVVNTGYFTIKKLACYKDGEYSTPEFELKPGKTETLIKSCDSIVPIIEVDSKFIGCSEKQIKVECNE